MSMNRKNPPVDMAISSDYVSAKESGIFGVLWLYHSYAHSNCGVILAKTEFRFGFVVA